MKRRRQVVWGLIPAVLMLVVACAVNPVTGKKELMLFSEQQEIAMGADTDKEIREQYGIYDNPRLNAYVESVGRRMVPISHRPNLAYHFAVLDTPVVNAFAAPGGYIYVTRGILALMSSEAELAVVLGHEIGHVTARHSVKRMSGQLLVYLGLAVGSLMNKNVAKIAGVASLGFQLLFLKFSRSDEYQADGLGVLYSRGAGYNPGQVVRFFSALERLSDEGGGQRIPTFLSTHPLTKKRIQEAQAMLQPGDRALALRPEAYFGQIDGLIYGDNPRQGFVEGGTFYHPDMAFSFRVPQDWQVDNTPRQVVLADKNGKAALVMQAEASDADLETYLDNQAGKLTNPTSLGRIALAVNGLSAIQAAYRLPQEDGAPLRTQLTCIRVGRWVASLMAVAADEQFDSYLPAFRQAVRSFSRLSDRDKLARRPLQMRVVSAGGRENLQEIFRRNGVPEKEWKNLAVYNGMALDSIPAIGERVKVLASAAN